MFSATSQHMTLVPSSTPSTKASLPVHPAAPQHQEAGHRRGRATFRFLVFVLLAAALFSRGTPLWLGIRTRPAAIFTVDDKGLRHLAISAPPPTYPSASLANHVTGVVVATVSVDVNGKVKTVTIVDSPDAPTGLSVRNAVLQWRFRPLGASVPVELTTGNMVFYFHFLDGRGVVSSSEEFQAIRGVAPASARLSTQAPVRVIDETEFLRLRSSRAPVVLDARSRAAHLQGHRDGAVNVPFSELSTRAGAELALSRPIVIDCFPEQQYSGVCEVAAHILASRGFAEVSVLNRSRE
jgi:TonB family protein